MLTARERGEALGIRLVPPLDEPKRKAFGVNVRVTDEEANLPDKELVSLIDSRLRIVRAAMLAHAGIKL